MEILHLLEQIRMPWLNELMLLITHLGEETAFLVVALIVFWCVNKYQGYYLLGVGLFGNLANQFLKIACRVPRPWVKDPTLNTLEAAKPEATGYSFPSGHSQTAVGYLGCLVETQKNRIFRTVCIVLMVLVPFSRIYVGVHSLSDILVGSGMALAMVAIFKPLMLGKHGKRNIPWIFGGLLVLSIAYLLYVELYPFPADVDAGNYASAVKNGYTFLGCFAGVLVVFLVDEKKFNFDTKAVWWAQILKAVLGLGVVLLVKEGTRGVLELICGGHMISRAIRYFLVVVVAGIVWPLTFKWFGSLGKEKSNG